MQATNLIDIFAERRIPQRRDCERVLLKFLFPDLTHTAAFVQSDTEGVQAVQNCLGLMVRLLIDSEQRWSNFYVIIARERSPLGDAHYSVVRQLEAKRPYLIPQPEDNCQHSSCCWDCFGKIISTDSAGRWSRFGSRFSFGVDMLKVDLRRSADWGCSVD